MTPKQTEIIAFLREQLTRAEQSLSAREQGEACWRGGTSESWRAAGCRKTKAQRIEVAEREQRIGVKNRHEVAMFKAAITLIEANL